VTTDLTTWVREGQGTVTPLAEGGWEVAATTPFTLWCPTPLAGAAVFSFSCQVLTPETAMLCLACARATDGGPFFVPRTGAYDEYRAGRLEMYSVGFSRQGLVSDTVQPNAGTANLRRIGGAGQRHFTADRDRLGTATADLAAWQDWDTATLLASVREAAAATDRPRRYSLTCRCPRLTLAMDGEPLCTVVDHRPEPLHGGHFAVRCMTPGGRCLLRDLSLQHAGPPAMPNR
jgi:hypothetical protein